MGTSYIYQGYTYFHNKWLGIHVDKQLIKLFYTATSTAAMRKINNYKIIVIAETIGKWRIDDSQQPCGNFCNRRQHCTTDPEGKNASRVIFRTQ